MTTRARKNLPRAPKPPPQEREWVLEYPLRAVQQITLFATSRAQAAAKLRALYDGEPFEGVRVDYEPLDVTYTRTGVGRVVGPLK